MTDDPATGRAPGTTSGAPDAAAPDDRPVRPWPFVDRTPREPQAPSHGGDAPPPLAVPSYNPPTARPAEPWSSSPRLPVAPPEAPTGSSPSLLAPGAVTQPMAPVDRPAPPRYPEPSSYAEGSPYADPGSYAGARTLPGTDGTGPAPTQPMAPTATDHLAYASPPSAPPAADGWHTPYGSGVSPWAQPGLPPTPPPPAGRPGQASPTGAPRISRRRRWVVLAVAVGVVALVGAGFAAGRLLDERDGPSASGGSDRPGVGAVTPTTIHIDPADEPIAAVAAAVSPTVVQIETGSGLGSGVLYDPDGLILTAAHVIDDARGNVQVRFSNGTTREARILGTDQATDIGVVQVLDPEGLPAPAALGVDVELLVGQTAVAIGSPFGLDQTVTAGIVSAVNRAVQTPGGAIDMIQTDAPINPGNSGGALVNRAGQVIGINDQIATRTGENSGVGFAIPIATAKAVADQLVSGQPVQFAFLGVSSRSAVAADGGVIVTAVTPGSAAERAGIEQGNQIKSVNGRPVRTPVELAAAIRSHKPGTQVTLVVSDEGDEAEVQLVLGSGRG